MTAADEKRLMDRLQLMEKELGKTREELGEASKLIAKLTAPPLTYATVVSVPQETKLRDDSIVKIRPDSPHFGQNTGVGRIIGVSKAGNIIVRFDNGEENTYEPTELQLANGKPMVVVLDGHFYEVLPPSFAVKPGNTVTVTQSMQILCMASIQTKGDVAVVRVVLDENFAEVDWQSTTKVVHRGGATKLAIGDRVVLDRSAAVIVQNLGKDDTKFQFDLDTGVTWNDIGGLTEAKETMIEAVVLPHKRPDIFKFYNKRTVKGVLLYGPPGCGKTMLGKATATALAEIYSGKARSTGFIYVKGPEILDKFVGATEATIRQIFQSAKKHKEDNGYPAVVFIDEADAILNTRGSGRCSDMERTIVPMFLAEMDGMDESGALVILATNRPDILDPAVVRDGRVDRKVEITRPTPESTVEIFQMNLAKVPFKNGDSVGDMARLAASEVFNAKRVLYNIHTRTYGELILTLGHVVNGGMIVNVVDMATSIALRRDLDKKKPEGLLRDDLIRAVDLVEQQNHDIEHTDVIDKFTKELRNELVSVQKVRRE